MTRHLFALYLLVTDIEVPARAERQLERIGDALYNFLGFIDLSGLWRFVYHIGDCFEQVWDVLANRINIDFECPGAFSAYYQLTNSINILALLLLFQSDLLLYCKVTILKFGRGRNAAVKYAVDNGSDFAYESALVLEQLAVASWSLRLYYYGWLPQHDAGGKGGFTSYCNWKSGGGDGTLFFITNLVAWLMAPFQIYM